MRLLPFYKHILVTCFVFPAFYTHAQSNEADSLSYINAKQYIISLYHESMAPETGLFNGSQYISYAQTIQEGIPFFESAEFNKGYVFYSGVLYENIPLQYDLVKGELITIVPSSNYNIRLINDKITGFSLLSHRFVRLIKDSSDKVIKTGFYEVLYEGNIAAYKKQTKNIGEDLSSGKLRTFIVESKSFYLKKGNSYFNITSKGSLLAVLKDRKKEIQDFIRKNKLNVRKDKDNALPKIAAFYDGISNTTAPKAQ
ncbi:hypothetical protein BH10BAC2_BH10BAC2_21300 [soil metagenome]